MRVYLRVPCWTNYQTYQGNPCGVYPDLSSFTGSGVYPDLSSFSGSGVYPDLSSFTGSGVIQNLRSLYQTIRSYSGSHQLRNFFYKCWPIIFFYGRGYLFVRCCHKNLQFRSARFFRSSSTEYVFRPTPPCFHFLCKENISQPRQKKFTDTDRKTR